MPPLDLTTPTLYAEHETEMHRTVNPDHSVSEVELPGYIVVGVELNGVRKPLHRFKAGGFLDDVRRAESARQSQPENSSSGY